MDFIGYSVENAFFSLGLQTAERGRSMTSVNSVLSLKEVLWIQDEVKDSSLVVKVIAEEIKMANKINRFFSKLF